MLGWSPGAAVQIIKHPHFGYTYAEISNKPHQAKPNLSRASTNYKHVIYTHVQVFLQLTLTVNNAIFKPIKTKCENHLISVPPLDCIQLVFVMVFIHVKGWNQWLFIHNSNQKWSCGAHLLKILQGSLSCGWRCQQILGFAVQERHAPFL